MNFLALSLVLMALFGTSFQTESGVNVLSENATAVVSLLSIFAAAVLVRLNRGLPTVDWKSVDPGDLGRLLDRLEDVAREYVIVFCQILFALFFVFISKFVPQETVFSTLIVPRWISGIVGSLLGLCVSRIVHLVWLDVSIIRLQRRVIVSAAEENDRQKQAEIANEKLAEIARARILPDDPQ